MDAPPNNRPPARAGHPWLAPALLSLVLAVASWPLLLQPRTRVLGHTDGDFATIAWGIWSVAQGRPGPRHPELRFPDGGVVLMADLPETLALVPFTRLFGPIFSFNLLQVAHLLLAAAGASLLARQRGLGPWGIAAAGLVFGLNAPLLVSLHSGNPEVSPVYLVPLAALLAGRAIAGPGPALLSGLVLGLSAWCNPYVAVMAGLAALVAFPWSAPTGRLRALVLLALPAAVLGLANFATLGASLDDPGSMIDKTLAPPGFPGPAWLSGFAWPELDRSQTGGAVHAWYLGLVPLALSAWGAARRWVEARRWLLLALLGVLLALGPSLHLSRPDGPQAPGLLVLPGAWLALLPGLDQMRLVFRFAALASLGLGLVAGLAVDRLPRAARPLALGLLLLDLLALAPGARWMTSSPALPSPVCAHLAELPAGPIVDLPGTRDGRYLLARTCHGQPVAQGLHQPWSNGVRKVLQGPSPQVLPGLRALGFRTLALHHGVKGERDAQVAVLARMAAERGAVLVADASVTLVDLAAFGPADQKQDSGPGASSR